MLWLTLPALASPTALDAWSTDLARPGCHRAAADHLAASLPDLPPHQQAATVAQLPQLAGAPTPPPGALTCFAVPGDHQLVTEHFVVSWDDGVVDEAGALAVADALELSWTRLFDELGWERPAGSDRWHLSVHLSADPFEGGYTTETRCGGEDVPFIVIGAGTFAWGTWYQDVAAHELLHTSHYRYGRAFDSWWWEATAIWIQEQVFPANDEWAYYVDFFVAYPHWSLTTSSYSGDPARHMYGSALWVFWLEQEHGGHDYVQSLWERSRDLPGNLQAEMDDVLGPERSMDAEFVRFAEAMVVNGIGEGTLYDGPAHEAVAALPAVGGSVSPDHPERWGMHYVRFTGDALPAEGLEVVVDADPSVQVSLLGVVDGAIVAHGVETSAGAWQLEPADALDEAWLVAVNTGVAREPVAFTAYPVGEPPAPTGDTASAAATADTGTVPLPTGDTGSDEGPVDDDGVAVDERGCGCASAPATRPLGWLIRRR